MKKKDLNKIIINAARSAKGKNILKINTKKKTYFIDYIIIITSLSYIHSQGIFNKIKNKTKKSYDFLLEGDQKKSEWIIMDFYDVVVHIMSADYREIYNLEKIWE